MSAADTTGVVQIGTLARVKYQGAIVLLSIGGLATVGWLGFLAVMAYRVAADLIGAHT